MKNYDHDQSIATEGHFFPDDQAKQIEELEARLQWARQCANDWREFYDAAQAQIAALEDANRVLRRLKQAAVEKWGGCLKTLDVMRLEGDARLANEADAIQQAEERARVAISLWEWMAADPSQVLRDKAQEIAALYPWLKPEASR